MKLIRGANQVQLSVDVEVDPEEEQRPEQDREDRAHHGAPAAEVLEVVPLRGEGHADDHPDQPDQAAPEHAQISAR